MDNRRFDRAPAAPCASAETRLSNKARSSAEARPSNKTNMIRARRGAQLVLARLTRLYTLGETSSLSMSEVGQLVDSMAYVLGVSSIDAPQAVAVLSREDVLQQYECRRKSLEVRAAHIYELWREVAARMPPIPNKVLVENMHSVRQVPAHYNTYFGAQKVPASLDYLPHGFVEKDGPRLKGLEAVELWLACALDEAEWLQQFPLERLVSTLELHAPGYLDACTSLRDLAEPFLDGN